ncbi:MAG: alpha/beta hydrolase [Microbacterium sp.]
MTEPTERTYTDAHGVEIVFDHYPAAGDPRAVVQLLHGIGEHARRYGNLIDALTADGYIVYADDHRGHGRTGERQHGGDPSKIGHLGAGDSVRRSPRSRSSPISSAPRTPACRS